MLVDFYNYISALGSSSLLIWHQQHTHGGPGASVVLRGFAYDHLSPMNAPTDDLCTLMRTRKLPVLTHDAPLFDCSVPTSIIDEWIDVQFPKELRGFKELLILCSSSAIQRGP
jgi:hypothetical protein